MENQKAITISEDSITAAAQKLREIVKERFPLDHVVKVKRRHGGGCFHGLISVYGDAPEEIGLLLEHRDIRWFSVEDIQVVPFHRVPAWWFEAIGRKDLGDLRK